MQRLLSEGVAVVGVINPDATAANTYTTGWIDMSKYPELLAIILAGALGTSATVDAKFQQANTAAGGDAKDITGKAITQLTQAGTDRSNKQAQINLRAESLDRSNGFRWARLSVTVATATSDLAALVIAANPRYGAIVPADTVIETIE